MNAYAELAVTTNFSFLRGASHPAEMVATADALGLAAIGIADRNSFAGVVRAYDEWKKRKNIKLIVGTRLVTVDGFEVLTYPTDRQAYGRLCQLLTQGNLKAKKGECHLTFEQILDAGEGQIFIALPPEELSRRFSPRASPLWSTQRPAAPSLPACIITAATSRGGSVCWPSSASGTARRSSPSTTCIITRRSAGRSSTSSPASARNARSPSRLPARRQCRAPS